MQKFQVKDKLYLHSTNKVSGRGRSITSMPTVDEVLVFVPKEYELSELHVNFKDPRVDWATNFMDEYVCNYNCIMHVAHFV